MRKGLICLGIALGCLCTPIAAKAGGINGNEASVIAAARGTFEYEGETYVAKDSYVAQLQAKLSQDDVDLTAEQASEAIAEIYSNVATGVKEGYLQKVSGSGGQGNETGTGAGAGKSQDDKKGTDGQSGKNGEKGQNGNDGSQGEEAGTGAEGSEASDGQTSTDVRSEKPSKGEFSLDMKKALEAIRLTEQSTGKEVEKALKEQYQKPVMTVYPIVLLLLTAMMLVALVIKKKGKWKKIWPSGLAMLLLIFGMTIGSLAAITEFGFFSGRVLVNQVASEGYYNKVYETFHKNLNTILTSAGFPEGILDDMIDEKAIYLDGKLALEASFNTNRTKEFLNIQDEMKEALMDYLEEENYSNISGVSDAVGNLAGMIQSSYVDSLKFTYSEVLLEDKEAGQRICNQMIAVGIFLCVAALILLVLGQRYIHRIFRLVGWSSIVPALATALTAGWYLLTGRYQGLALIPEDYNRFFVSYLKWNAELLLAIAALEFVIFLICVIMTLSLRKTHRRNPYQKIK